MTLYAGLDISLEDTHVCVVDHDGKIVMEDKVATDPHALREALEPHGSSLARVGVEASSLGGWLHDELTEYGLPVIVIEAHHARAAMDAQRNKTDKNDAEGLAHIMRTGWYKAVYVKSQESQRLRMLLANRRLLKRKLVDMENHIRGTLRAFGLRIGAVSRGQFEARVTELVEIAEEDLSTFITTMLKVRSNLVDGYKTLHKFVLDIVREDPICRRLMTVPGVGPITALSFRASVDDPLRFKRSRTVGAYFGLTPRKWQSGSIDREGRITKQGDVEVRAALCEAAASLLIRTRKWIALKAWGLRIAKRTNMMNAIVAVARKLAVILHRMWLDGSEFRVGHGAKVQEKLRLTPPKMA